MGNCREVLVEHDTAFVVMAKGYEAWKFTKSRTIPRKVKKKKKKIR